MKITYNGHACFSITSGGFTIIIDPYSPGSVPGYEDLNESANQILCTHEHGDHNARNVIHQITGTDSPFTIQTISTWHDDAHGQLRGSNTIFILCAEGRHIVHLGDLGCPLSSSELGQIRGCDVLLIPVGGHYTIDAAVAAAIARQVEAGITVPMHYSGKGFGYDVIAPVDAFIRQMSDVKALDTASIELPMDDMHKVIVLHAKYRQK